MDPITHPLTGMLIGAAAARDRRLLYPLALTGILAATLPDLDAPPLHLLDLLEVAGPERGFYATYHRVFTHTILIAPVLALLGALPGWLWAKTRFGLFYLISLGSILMHLLMDWPCDWQLLLLWPLSGYNFSNGKPLMDLAPHDTYMTVLVVVALAASAVLYLRSNQKPPARGPEREEKKN